MSDETTQNVLAQIQGAPMTLAQCIVAEAERHVGESEQGGRNQGPPVEFSCKRWLSETRYQEMLAAGRLEWCMAFDCSVIEDAGSSVIRQIASTSCTTFWERAREVSINQDSQPPEARTVSAWRASNDGALVAQPGDVLLTDSDRNGKPNHAVIIVGIDEETREFLTIGGNSGPRSDAVARRRYSMDSPSLFGFVRVLR